MGVFTYESEVTSSVPPAKMFKAAILDSDNLIPKVRPQAIKNVEIIQGEGGPGTIKKIHFGEGSKFKSMTHRVDAIDKENFTFSYTVVDGDVLTSGIESISQTFPLDQLISLIKARRPGPSPPPSLILINMMKSFKEVHIPHPFLISVCLLFILTTTLVASAGVQSSLKDSVLRTSGPVPPSAASSCSHIGGHNGGDHPPCHSSPHQDAVSMAKAAVPPPPPPPTASSCTHVDGGNGSNRPSPPFTHH